MNLPTLLHEKTGAAIETKELLSPDCILAVACFTNYLSADTFFSSGLPSCSYASFVTKINRLVRRSYLKPIPLPEKDGNILKLYRLTEAGHSYASRLFEQDVPAFRQKRQRKDVMGSAMHDYSASLNFLPFLSLSFCKQLRAETEVSFLAGTRTDHKNHKALCADIFFSLSSHDGSRQQVYVEEDLGTENVRTLIKKLSAYCEQGFLGREGHLLLFSFRKPYAKVQKSVFSYSYISKLLPYVKGSLQETGQMDVPKDLREVLPELKKVFPSSTDREALMKFARELQANVCPLRDAQLGRSHLSLFHARRNNMRDLLLKLPEGDKVLRAIYGGAAIGCGATPRIADAFPFLFYKDDRFLEKNHQLQSYARYFPGLDTESYEAVHPFSSGREDAAPLAMRNVYTCKKPDGSRRYVAFEDISHDLGGILRCARMISSFSKDSDPVSVIMNASSAGEAISFATRFSYLYELDHPFPDRAFLYFTIRANGNLYCVTRDFDTGKGILRQLQPL